MKSYWIVIAVLSVMIGLQSCSSPTPRLLDDALSIKAKYQSRYKNIYCDSTLNVLFRDGATLHGTVLGLHLSRRDSIGWLDTTVVFLPQGSAACGNQKLEIPIQHIELPALLKEMAKNAHQNINRFVVFNNVTGVPEIRDVPIDSCDCNNQQTEGRPSKRCETAPCRPYFVEARVVPGLFAYVDQSTVAQSVVRRSLGYEFVAGYKFGGIQFDLNAYLKALVDLKLGLEFELGCPCARVDTLFDTVRIIQRSGVPEVSVKDTMICIINNSNSDSITTTHRDTLKRGTTVFIGFDPLLRLFGHLRADIDGDIRAKLGITPACNRWGIGVAYDGPTAVYNSYGVGGSVDIQRPLSLIHLRYDFNRYQCAKPFCYVQLGTALDALTLKVWKNQFSTDPNIDNAIDQIEKNCSTCNLGGAGGTLQLPSVRSSLGGFPVSYGFGAGIEYPMFSTLDFGIDFGYRSLAAGEAIPYNGIDLPLYRRIGMWRLRVGVTW